MHNLNSSLNCSNFEDILSQTVRRMLKHDPTPKKRWQCQDFVGRHMILSGPF
jgi:hypothetical protein